MLTRAVLTLSTLFIVTFGARSAPAQESDLEIEYAKKLEKKFSNAVEWQHELEAAKKASREKNIPIIAYFTRSYAP